MDYVVLKPDHPAVTGMQIEVDAERKRVSWRDIHTVRQEREFDTELAARQFAFILKATALFVHVDDVGGDLQEALASWPAQ